MDTTPLQDASAQLPQLIDRALAGEDIVISMSGKPVVRLVPCESPQRERHLGLWKGQVWMADDFDDLPEDVASAFRGEQP